MTRALCVGLAAAAAILTSCRTPVPHQPLRQIIGEESRVASWIESTARISAERKSLRATARASFAGPDGTAKFREIILVERPDRLRLESLNFLGQTQTLLVPDGEEFSFFDGRELERGRVSRMLLQERLGLDLEPAEAVAVLLAAPELPTGLPHAVYGRDGDRVADFGAKRVGFGPDGELQAVERLERDGSVRWRVEYTRWRDVSGGRYPSSMVLHFPGSEIRAELDLRDVELNLGLDPALFQLPESRSE